MLPWCATMPRGQADKIDLFGPYKNLLGVHITTIVTHDSCDLVSTAIMTDLGPTVQHVTADVKTVGSA